MKQLHKILTLNEIWLDYNNPKPEDILLVDIAAGLSKCCRWQGQIDGFLSVAEHSVMGVNILARLGATPEEKLHFALHDAHEAYTGDIGSPLKSIPGIARTIKRIQYLLDEAIFHKFDIELKERPLIKQVDLALLNFEWAAIKNMPLTELPERDAIKKVPIHIRNLTLKRAEIHFWSPSDARVAYVSMLTQTYNTYKQWKHT